MKNVAPIPKLLLESVESGAEFPGYQAQSLRKRAVVALFLSLLSVTVALVVFHIITVKVYRPVVEKLSEDYALQTINAVSAPEEVQKVHSTKFRFQQPPHRLPENDLAIIGEVQLTVPSVDSVLENEFFEEEVFELDRVEPPKKRVKAATPQKVKTKTRKSRKKSSPSDSALTRKITQKAKLVSRGKINYPRKARQKGYEGTVLVTVTVDHAGRVQAASIKRSSQHSALDGAALKAARKYQFSPALNGLGKSVVSKIDIPFTFKLS